jgi:phenylpyruvate tautomerase PptA (4-oxalocrotonate tautomerase family)
MPIIEVKLFDYRLTEGVTDKIIAALTDGLCEACGEEVRERTEVIVQGISPQVWGFGGKTITSGGAAS